MLCEQINWSGNKLYISNLFSFLTDTATDKKLSKFSETHFKGHIRWNAMALLNHAEELEIIFCWK